MNNKPKNNQTTHIVKIMAFLSFALILALSPVSADAKTIELTYSPFSSTVLGNFDLKSTSVQIADVSGPDNNSNVLDQDTLDNIDQAQRLDAYFQAHDMPLYGYGDEFVAAADKYGIDWRLLAAIGVRESSGGKHLMNNNPFGWGSAKIKYSDFSEAIDNVSAHLGGAMPTTSRYYKDADTMKKLWYYNGSVMPKYPAQVVSIMNSF